VPYTARVESNTWALKENDAKKQNEINTMETVLFFILKKWKPLNYIKIFIGKHPFAVLTTRTGFK
jgi:hypothetical protein